MSLCLNERLGTVWDAYFQVTTEEMCLTVPLIVENKVAKVQEASLIIYDYYESCKETLSFQISFMKNGLERNGQIHVSLRVPNLLKYFYVKAWVASWPLTLSDSSKDNTNVQLRLEEGADLQRLLQWTGWWLHWNYLWRCSTTEQTRRPAQLFMALSAPRLL